METTTMMAQLLFFTILCLLAYTYLIYPMVAIVIGSGRARQWNRELPKISILVPAHNEAAVIAKKIDNFNSLDYPSHCLELLIYDDGSTDQTADIVQGLTSDRIRLLSNTTRGGKANAMNHLVEEAQHSLLLFSDANVMLNPEAPQRLVDHLADEHVGAVTGEVRLVDSDLNFSAGEQFYYWLERRIQGAESRIGSVMGVDGAMYLIRQELYQTLPEDTILDDFLVSMQVMRAGRRIVYECAAKATESGTPTVGQEFSRRVRIAAGGMQLLKRQSVPRASQVVLWLQFISHKILRWFSPVLLTLLMVANVAIWKEHHFFKWLFFAQMLLYAFAACVCLFRPLRQTRIGGVLFYFGLSQIAIAAGIIKGLFDLQPPQWRKGSRVKSTDELS